MSGAREANDLGRHHEVLNRLDRIIALLEKLEPRQVVVTVPPNEFSDTRVEAGGWVCGKCGSWVAAGQTHTCTSLNDSTVVV